ncbi:hypothetical protein LEMLEM_LOCUS27521 [Lemmus lemmus]
MEAGVGGRFLCGDWRRRTRPGRALQSLASFQPALGGSSPAHPRPQPCRRPRSPQSGGREGVRLSRPEEAEGPGEAGAAREAAAPRRL